MKTISMLEFRKDAETIVRSVQQGQRLVLTYRGKPVARIEPILEETVTHDDPFYKLYEQADETGDTLSNEEMDELIYGS